MRQAMIGCGKRMGTGLSDLRAEGGVRVRAESVYAHGPKAAWVQACTRIEARTDAHALKVAKVFEIRRLSAHYQRGLTAGNSDDGYQQAGCW